VAIAWHTQWDKLERTAGPGKKALERKVCHVQQTRELLQKTKLKHWMCSHWDFGSIDTANEDRKTKAQEDKEETGETELLKMKQC